jgi:hypothetical protein
LNDITSLPNVMKIYQAVQKLLVGDTQTDTDTHTHTQTGDLISLLSFLKSRLKSIQNYDNKCEQEKRCSEKIL